MSTEQPPGGGQQPPTEEELRAAFEEQMRRITVPDVILQTAVTLINLGAQKLGEDGDLAQAKLAIDGARALIPLLPGSEDPDDDLQGQLKNALSQLQMAFVQASQQAAQESEGGAEAGAEGGAEPAAEGGGEPAKQAGVEDEAERAKARSKIWTPPGT